MAARCFIIFLVLTWLGCRHEEPPKTQSQSILSIPHWGSETNFRPELRTNREIYEVFWDRMTQADQFRRVVESHLDLEIFSDHVHLPAIKDFPDPLDLGPTVPGNPYFTRIYVSRPSSALLNFRTSLANHSVPLRGYWAPIFTDTKQATPIAFLKNQEGLSERELAAARLIEAELNRAGLKTTLLELMKLLGPRSFMEDPEMALRQIRNLGYPVDWLSKFAGRWQNQETPVHGMVQELARGLTREGGFEEMQSLLSSVDFNFNKSHPHYRVASESGRDAIGMVRMQMGGGYHDGIVPGGSIDVIAQMIREIPSADFTIHVQENIMENVKWMARRHWPLQRTNQLTMLIEEMPISPWAQDNGKAGTLKGSQYFATPQHVTLIPRYASQEEMPSRFMPSESFLMETLHGSGHPVIHSPLLFQGGNLLAVTQPGSRKILLLIGEAEIERNRSLGLTEDEVLEAFRIEFGADRCVRLPAASFHIDYDMTIREHAGKLVAFVNDTMAAVRSILDRGIDAMQSQNLIIPAQVAQIKLSLTSGRFREAYLLLSRSVHPLAAPNGVYPESFQSLFKTHPVDSSSHNMRVFLVALDLLASRALLEEDLAQLPEFYRGYLASLRLIDAQAERQREILQSLGCRTVLVPSLPDVPAGFNYLNGLQDRKRYFLPVQGGFYQSLDQAAAHAFSSALGETVEIVPILTGECQRSHGSLHCAASAYPELKPKRDSS